MPGTGRTRDTHIRTGMNSSRRTGRRVAGFRTETSVHPRAQRQPTTRTALKVLTCRCMVDKWYTALATDTTRERTTRLSNTRMAATLTKLVYRSLSSHRKGAVKVHLGNQSIRSLKSECHMGYTRAFISFQHSFRKEHIYIISMHISHEYFTSIHVNAFPISHPSDAGWFE